MVWWVGNSLLPVGMGTAQRFCLVMFHGMPGNLRGANQWVAAAEMPMFVAQWAVGRSRLGSARSRWASQPPFDTNAPQLRVEITGVSIRNSLHNP